MISKFIESVRLERRRNKVFWWSKGKGHLNVGDDVSPILASRILEMMGVDIDSEHPRKRMLAIGSILHFARTGDCIWGSGVNGKIAESAHQYADLDVRAVRGPLTRRFLEGRDIQCPETYGDPALLLPLFYPKSLFPEAKHDFIVIPHVSEAPEAYESVGQDRILFPATAPAAFIRGILSARKVISSSLHGVIFAEAYGVPAVWLRGKTAETDFKYDDYYLGTGRSDYQSGESIEECLDILNSPIPDLERIQGGLISSFPIDLWSKG